MTAMSWCAALPAPGASTPSTRTGRDSCDCVAGAAVDGQRGAGRDVAHLREFAGGQRLVARIRSSLGGNMPCSKLGPVVPLGPGRDLERPHVLGRVHQRDVEGE